MNPHFSALSYILRRPLFATSILALVAGPTLGCDSSIRPDHTLRADLSAIRAIHGDPEAIGALDSTAPPADLNDYRKPAYRTVSAR